MSDAIESSLINALQDNNVTELHRLLNAHPDEINKPRGLIKWTLLMLAVRLGLTAAVDLLCKAGANPNDGDRDGATALFYLTDKSSPQLLDLLVFHGADVNVQSRFGTLAIHNAVNEGLEEALILLVSAGTNLSLDKDCQLMMSAIDHQQSRLFQILIRLGAPFHCPTLLQLACEQHEALYVSELKARNAPFTAEMLDKSPYKHGSLGNIQMNTVSSKK
jgi:ankyrin repeat protein